MDHVSGPHATRVGAIRRKTVDLSQFNPVRERLLADEQTLPLVLEPTADDVDLAA